MFQVCRTSLWTLLLLTSFTCAQTRELAQRNTRRTTIFPICYPSTDSQNPVAIATISSGIGLDFCESVTNLQPLQWLDQYQESYPQGLTITVQNRCLVAQSLNGQCGGISDITLGCNNGKNSTYGGYTFFPSSSVHGGFPFYHRGCLRWDLSIA